MEANLNPRQFKNYPNRRPLLKDKIMIPNPDGEEDLSVIISNENALLNRVRTGHTKARVHLKNIRIEKENKCRHCNRHKETIEHQLIRCRKYRKRLKKFREKYIELEIDDFDDALYSHSAFMADFISYAYKKGCYI